MKIFLKPLLPIIGTSVPDVEWTTDTEASNHMTAHSGMLQNLKKYVGHDSVFIGDGS